MKTRAIRSRIESHGSVIVFAGVLLAGGCGGDSGTSSSAERVSAGDVAQDVQETVATAGTYAEQQRDQFMKTMEDRVAQLEAKVKELQARAEAQKAQLDAETTKYMAELDQKLRAARRAVDDAGADAGKAWADVKTGVQAAVDELQQAWKNASSRFAEAAPD